MVVRAHLNSVGSTTKHRDVVSLDFTMTISQRKNCEWLRNVPGVEHVEWQTSKTEQGNISDNHYLELNIPVTSSIGLHIGSKPLIFECTRNQHQMCGHHGLIVASRYQGMTHWLVTFARVSCNGKRWLQATPSENR